MANVKLYCANFSYDVTDEDLKQDIGGMANVKIIEAQVAVDKVSKRSRGFGFITVAEEDVDTVLALHGGKYTGRKFICEIAKPKADIPHRKSGEPDGNK